MKIITIISFIVLGFINPSFAIIDSVGTETVDGKIVVLHRVEPKETLYSIHRKYGVAVDVITAANPGADMGIGVGQILKIPTQKTASSTEEVIKNIEKSSTTSTENKHHVVKPGETLYAISTLYPCSVDDIKKWNGLTSNALDVGQKLIVGKQESSTVADNKEVNETTTLEEKKAEAVEEIVEDELDDLTATTTDGREIDIDLNVRTKAQVEEDKKQQDIENTNKLLNANTEVDSIPSKRSVDMGGYVKEFEKGYAVLMEGTATDERYLAHHRTLPEGTILQVKNLDNDKSVFVRIVGVLEHDDPKVIISLSSKAEIRLKSENTTFLTEISYIP